MGDSPSLRRETSISETNGKSRLDRIEEMIERSEKADEAGHERFEEEDKRIFAAQILMNGALQKLLGITEKLIETTDKLVVTMDKLVVTTDKLGDIGGQA